MPDLTGLPVVSAQSALAKVGIKSAAPRYVNVPVAPSAAETRRQCCRSSRAR